MELTHQLTPMLRTLRLSGILETLEVRNRQAVEPKERQATCQATCLLRERAGFGCERVTLRLEPRGPGFECALLGLERCLL